MDSIPTSSRMPLAIWASAVDRNVETITRSEDFIALHLRFQVSLRSTALIVYTSSRAEVDRSTREVYLPPTRSFSRRPTLDREGWPSAWYVRNGMEASDALALRVALGRGARRSRMRLEWTARVANGTLVVSLCLCLRLRRVSVNAPIWTPSKFSWQLVPVVFPGVASGDRGFTCPGRERRRCGRRSGRSLRLIHQVNLGCADVLQAVHRVRAIGWLA